MEMADHGPTILANLLYHRSDSYCEIEIHHKSIKTKLYFSVYSLCFTFLLFYNIIEIIRFTIKHIILTIIIIAQL